MVQGAYADYQFDNQCFFCNAPWFISSSGQLLFGAFEAPGTPGNGEPPILVNGIVPGDGNASLDWTVQSRTGNIVLLDLSFHAVGCQDNEIAYHIGNQSAAQCTYYDINPQFDLSVNLTNDESYVNGADVGILDFWEPPLLQNGTVEGGSVFINRQKFISESNVSSLLPSSLLGLGNTVNVSGTQFSALNSPFELYYLKPITFCQNSSNYQIGFISSELVGQASQASPLGPSGYYDYYNGLAFDFDIPQAPVNETVCDNLDGRALDCQLANVSTTLGQFFQSGGGQLVLSSTNIPLTPSQETPTTTTSLISSSSASLEAISEPLPFSLRDVARASNPPPVLCCNVRKETRRFTFGSRTM